MLPFKTTDPLHACFAGISLHRGGMRNILIRNPGRVFQVDQFRTGIFDLPYALLRNDRIWSGGKHHRESVIVSCRLEVVWLTPFSA